MRHVLFAAALVAGTALAACGGGGYSDDGGSYSYDDGRGGGTGAACNGSVATADWCGRCSAFDGAADGRCAACGNAATTQEACVRTAFSCSECQTNHASPCALNDSYQCCTQIYQRARIVCACGTSCTGDSCAKCKQSGGCKKRCTHG